jgi:hypothetical protein
VRHGKNIHGLAAGYVTVRDPEIRRALEAITAPSNYDPEMFAFVDGRLTVRREWVQGLVQEMLDQIVAQTESGEAVEFDVVAE